MDGDWWIGLDGWVLQDGNYPDFVTGERRRFAVEFGYRRDRRLRPSPEPGVPSCSYTGHGTAYAVTGQLLRATDQPQGDAFVLDFGLLSYAPWMVLDDLQPPVTGDWLSGEIHLGVDPFFYKDELAGLPGMPALTYTWTVEEIQLDLTPSMVVEHGHPLYPGPDEGPRRVRDVEREAWRTIDRTRMWDDDGSYRLRCVLHA